MNILGTHTYIYIYVATHTYIYRRISFASNFKPRTPNTQPASAMPRKRSTRSSKGKGRPISISKVWLKASSLNGLAERVFFAFCLLLFFFKWALFHLQLFLVNTLNYTILAMRKPMAYFSVYTCNVRTYVCM